MRSHARTSDSCGCAVSRFQKNNREVERAFDDAHADLLIAAERVGPQPLDRQARQQQKGLGAPWA
jgi:hypothetical protein